MRLIALMIAALLVPSLAFTQAKEESEQIVIRLSADNQLMPLYLAKFTDEGSGLDSRHAKVLADVLQFDLNHNGLTYTVAQTEAEEKLADKLSAGNPSLAGNWKAFHVFYVIKVRVNSDKKLEATLLSVNGDSVKSVTGIPLSGDLIKDRKQIHQLADAIHKSLFGTEGIASTHILYTIRKPASEAKKWTSEVWKRITMGKTPAAL